MNINQSDQREKTKKKRGVNETLMPLKRRKKKEKNQIPSHQFGKRRKE